MKVMYSTLFFLSPESWLGKRLDGASQSMVISPKEVFLDECKPQKGASVSEELRANLEHEMLEIEALPNEGIALRADRIEDWRAKEVGGSRNPSVDICLRAGTALMLVECKYRAMPETSIVKSVKTFQEKVCRKFDASQSFYSHEGVQVFWDERIVLFNCKSKDKVLSMFRRLQLEGSDSSLRRYLILDTRDFWVKYGDVVMRECM